jgi:hypothetical protein
MVFAGIVARMGGRKVFTGVWWRDLREIEHLKDLGVDGRIILKWIYKKKDGKHGLDCSGSGQKQTGAACECGKMRIIS